MFSKNLFIVFVIRYYYLLLSTNKFSPQIINIDNIAQKACNQMRTKITGSFLQ